MSDNEYNIYIIRHMPRRDTEDKQHFTARRKAFPVILQIYRDIFNYEFNLDFHVPKKDLCDLCERFRMASDTEKAAMQTTYNFHQHNKNLSWKNKEEDDKERGKTNVELSVACFNLQQV